MKIMTLENIGMEAAEEAYRIIKSGGIVIFPTETVFGIGCDIYNTESIKKIYSLKNRPLDKPLAAYINSAKRAALVSKNIPQLFFKLADKYLPGPLTIILESKDEIPLIARSHQPTIGIRIPANKFMLELLSKPDIILAGTSANLSGNMSTADFKTALSPFQDRIDAAIYDNSEYIGKESTVISLLDNQIKLIRQGAIAIEEILDYVNYG